MQSKHIFGVPNFGPNVEKPKENQCFPPQTLKNLRKIDVFGLRLGPGRNYHKHRGPGTFLVIFGQNLTKFDQAGMSKFWGLLFFWEKNRRRPPGLGTQGFMYHPSLAWLACLALACLAILASYRPRSPCLHQQQQQRRSAPPGRRRRPGCCCEVQARRARPIRGEASQASQGQPSKPSQRYVSIRQKVRPTFNSKANVQ